MVCHVVSSGPREVAGWDSSPRLAIEARKGAWSAAGKAHAAGGLAGDAKRVKIDQRSSPVTHVSSPTCSFLSVYHRVLTPAESMKTAEGCRIQTLEKGQRIVKETEEVHSFYVLKSGSVSVAAGSSSRKGAAYASQKDSVFDRLYPFSMYSPASNLTETESTSAASRKQSSKLPVLSAARNFLFPIASSIAPMSSGYTVTALVPASANVSKVSILEIPQKVPV